MYKGTMYVVITLVLLSAIPALPTSGYDKREAGHYLNMFLVQVDDQETAERVASDNGFQFIEKVRSLNYLVHCCFLLIIRVLCVEMKSPETMVYLHIP